MSFFKQAFSRLRSSPVLGGRLLKLGASVACGFCVTTVSADENERIPAINLSPIRYDDSTSLQIPLRSRDEHVASIQSGKQYDVIVIGGGCNGAGVFLEASQRGLTCLLLESEDFSAATSSKSTKLIHGGVRYLQEVFSITSGGSLASRKEKFGLVRESLKERTHFLENAYYMNRQLPFIIPTTNILTASYYYIGCLVYHGIYLSQLDRQSSFRFKMPNFYGSRQLEEYFPHINKKYKYGVVYHDGQFNDARMNLDILLTGTWQGQDDSASTHRQGDLLNYARVTGLVKNAENKTTGVRFCDKISGVSHEVEGKIVVNCAGTFADVIRKMDDESCRNRIIPVSGSHVTMPRNFSSRKHALVIPKTEDGRILFLVPWQDAVIVGTTERQLPETELNPTVTHPEIMFMLKEMSKLYPDVPSTFIADHVKSKWAGVRPLILEDGVAPKLGEKIDTKKIARKHVIEVSENGLVSLLGGKWTIYRGMGEQTVDKIFEILKEKGIDFDSEKAKNSTLNLRLLGEANRSVGYKFPTVKSNYVRVYAHAMADKYAIDYKVAKNLVKTYGVRAFDVLQVGSTLEKNMQGRLHPLHPFLKAEVVYQIRYEFAQSPLDVLLRRTRLAFIDRKAAFESLSLVVDIFAEQLHWDDAKKAHVLTESRDSFLKMDF